MTQQDAAGQGSGLTTRLAQTRLLVRAAMIFERAWTLFMPLLIVAGLFLSFSWFGLFCVLSAPMRLAVVAVFALATLGALYHLRFYRHPTAGEIVRRIERA